MSKAHEVWIGADVGGTGIKLGVFDSLTATVPFQAFEFPTSNDFQIDKIAMIRKIRALAESCEATIAGIGITLAGLLDDAATTLIGAGNLTGWIKQPILTDFEAAFPDVPVKLGNDAQGQALAEAIHGSRLRGQGFLMISFGTGIGVARVIMINGRPVALATEGGHLEIDGGGWGANTRICGCGSNICLECFAGGTGIKHRHHARASELSDDQWAEVMGWLVMGVAGILALHPVQHIVLGGGIALRTPTLVDWLDKGLQARKSEDKLIGQAPEVHLTELGQVGATLAGVCLLSNTRSAA